MWPYFDFKCTPNVCACQSALKVPVIFLGLFRSRVKTNLVHVNIIWDPETIIMITAAIQVLLTFILFALRIASSSTWLFNSSTVIVNINTICIPLITKLSQKTFQWFAATCFNLTVAAPDGR